jgi:hypothetical protein
MSQCNCSLSTAPNDGAVHSTTPESPAAKQDGSIGGAVVAQLGQISGKLDVIIDLLRRATLGPGTSGSADPKGDDACQNEDERRLSLDRTGFPVDAGESSTLAETGNDLIRTLRMKARQKTRSRKPDEGSR